jgi:hypothetical protein
VVRVNVESRGVDPLSLAVRIQFENADLRQCFPPDSTNDADVKEMYYDVYNVDDWQAMTASQQVEAILRVTQRIEALQRATTVSGSFTEAPTLKNE